MEIDLTNLESIKNAGFIGFMKIKELQFDPSKIINSPGVYLVLYEGPKHPEFLAIGTGGHFKGKNPNVSIEELINNWVDSASIVYIGKAGGEGSKATLQSRIKQYLKFGQGYDIGHYGGRLIWQLKNSKDLIICWKPIQNISPREIEAELIRQFNSHYGMLPFANLQY